MKARRQEPEAGVVLIAVLWGVMVLAAIALALSSSVRVGVEGLQNRKEHLATYYAARGGLFRTIALLTNVPATSEEQFFRPGQQKLEWAETPGRVAVEVSDETGKVDLNRASPEVLQRLFEALGLDRRSAQALVDAVEDWRDPDSYHRLNGAEESYYLALPGSYRPANADFQSVEELLLVRGVTPELFYGGYQVRGEGQVERQPGLIDCVTVYARSPRININYAPYPVLLAVPGLEPRVANYILSTREKQPFASVSELSREFPVVLGGETLSYLTTESSGRYALVASGTAPSGVTARIWALVEVQGTSVPPYRILAWDDFYVR